MSIAETTPSLELRRRPTQERARATFDRILDATASLLDSRGFDALTTNLISIESGVSVRAIYRYFPNKHAVVCELARRMESQWRQALIDVGGFDDPTTPWRDQWCAYVDQFVNAVRTTPGALALLNAMRSDPELRKADDESNAMYISDITNALMARQNITVGDEAQAIATVLIRSTVAVLDDAFLVSEDEAAHLVAVMKQMHLGLLARYLD